MGKLTCRNKISEEVCGNTFFAKVQVNEFQDFPTNLFTTLQEIDIDRDIKIYQCIKCGAYMTPPIDYMSMDELDKRLFVKVKDVAAGKTPKPDPLKRPTPIRPGTVGAIDVSQRNPENHGKFVAVGR